MSVMSPLLGDGSWDLRVLVTDLQVERTIRVKGDLHLGGVMLKLVDELGRTTSVKNCIKVVVTQWVRARLTIYCLGLISSFNAPRRLHGQTRAYSSLGLTRYL